MSNTLTPRRAKKIGSLGGQATFKKIGTKGMAKIAKAKWKKWREEKGL